MFIFLIVSSLLFKVPFHLYYLKPPILREGLVLDLFENDLGLLNPFYMIVPTTTCHSTMVWWYPKRKIFTWDNGQWSLVLDLFEDDLGWLNPFYMIVPTTTCHSTMVWWYPKRQMITWDNGRWLGHMTTNIVESINFVWEKTRNLLISYVMIESYTHCKKFFTYKGRHIATREFEDVI